MKHIIWSNDSETIGSIAAELLNDNPDMSYDAAWAEATEINADYLSDERSNLDIDVGGEVVIIADFGLWDGRRKGVMRILGNLANCIDACVGDVIVWYIEDGEMKIDDIHHDGTNHYLIRAWKDGVNEMTRGCLGFLIKNGCYDKDTLDKVTRPLGEKVSEIYGW